jgi:hypothetical protein
MHGHKALTNKAELRRQAKPSVSKGHKSGHLLRRQYSYHTVMKTESGRF